MSEPSSSSISIDAPAADIAAVLADLESYPTWTSAIKRVEVHERDASNRPSKVTVTVDAGVLKDRASLSYDWSKLPNEISFSLDEADMMTEMTGAYLIKDNGDETTTVTYSLTTQISMPVPEMMRRKVEMSTIDAALSQLKKKIEG
ncbi:MAG: polyketide cyclase / dehydrase and lipid transport [Actinobacteria bacterium]|nr:polyketide cyclase / dehydrase and lipid transport [Actinomycetota bacterium]